MPQEAFPSEKACKKHFASHLEASLSDELLQCSSFLNTEFAKKALDTTASSHSSTPAISLDETNEDSDMEDDTKSNVELPELRMYRLLKCFKQFGKCIWKVIWKHCYCVLYLPKPKAKHDGVKLFW